MKKWTRAKAEWRDEREWWQEYGTQSLVEDLAAVSNEMRWMM